jgi:hypothetical protein
MEVDRCREIGTELENFENIPFRGWIWSSTSADSLSRRVEASSTEQSRRAKPASQTAAREGKGMRRPRSLIQGRAEYGAHGGGASGRRRRRWQESSRCLMPCTRLAGNCEKPQIFTYRPLYWIAIINRVLNIFTEAPVFFT